MKAIIGIVCSLAFLSCNEEIKISSVEGILKESCDGKVIGNTDLVLLDSRMSKVIAATTTDHNGNFHLEYEMEEDISGSAELKYFNGEDFTQVMHSIPLNRTVEVLAIAKSTSTVIVNIHTQGNGILDTLLYSITESDVRHTMINPKTGDSDTLELMLPKAYNNSTNRILYWGLGSADYQKAKNSLNTSDSHNQVNFVAPPCETSILTIDVQG